MKKAFILACIAIAVLFSYPILADQTQIPNYQTAKQLFWGEIYPYGSWTLYCGKRFADRSETEDGMPLSIEHVYARSWMRDHLECGNHDQCQDTSERYRLMESDLHNMYAALRNVNSSRGDAPYGIIAGENWRYDYCDYERAGGIAEPRPIARGNIARSIFYMHVEYGLPVDSDLASLLKQWNRDDPTSCHEMRRNNWIEELQGTRNPFIDHPKNIEDLQF